MGGIDVAEMIYVCEERDGVRAEFCDMARLFAVVADAGEVGAGGVAGIATAIIIGAGSAVVVVVHV